MQQIMSAGVRLGLIAVFCVAACGAPGPHEVVLPRKVKASSGKPSVKKVVDMGDYGSIPGVGGKLQAFDSDGVYVVGELILIEGSSFGKQPTINIGGRPAERLARTGNGGIVTRIPTDVPTGKIEVEVSHTSGRGSMEIEVRRYGLIVQPGAGKVHVISVSTKGKARAHGTLDLPGAKAVAMAHNGQAAYVGMDASGRTKHGSLAIVAMSAKGGPKVVNKMRLAVNKVDFVAAAAQSPMAVVVGDGKLTPIALNDARNPALYDAWPLGDNGSRITAVRLDPKGAMAVLLRGKGNVVVPIDVSVPRQPSAKPGVGLLPKQRLPLVKDMGFSPDGKALWILSGDNDESVTAGEHATELTLTKVSGSSITVDKTVAITGAQVPMALAVGRRESILGGTAIRSTARKVAIVTAGVDPKLLSLVGKPGLPKLDAFGDATELGQLVRTDLEGKGESVWAADGVITDVEMTYDVRWLVSATTRIKRTTDNVSYEFGMLVTPVAGGNSSFLKLGDPQAEAGLLAPGSVALMP